MLNWCVHHPQGRRGRLHWLRLRNGTPTWLLRLAPSIGPSQYPGHPQAIGAIHEEKQGIATHPEGLQSQARDACMQRRVTNSSTMDRSDNLVRPHNGMEDAHSLESSISLPRKRPGDRTLLCTSIGGISGCLISKDSGHNVEPSRNLRKHAYSTSIPQRGIRDPGRWEAPPAYNRRRSRGHVLSRCGPAQTGRRRIGTPGSRRCHNGGASIAWYTLQVSPDVGQGRRRRRVRARL